MAHRSQRDFVEVISTHIAKDFEGRKTLEVGSYDVNGSVCDLFIGGEYIGVDLAVGPGVDVICEGNKLSYQAEAFDISMSCECFEHNPEWLATLRNMIRMTKGGGIVFFTCASKGRTEHGTARTLLPVCQEHIALDGIIIKIPTKRT